jgi:Ca-activated chloride channel homolog
MSWAATAQAPPPAPVFTSETGLINIVVTVQDERGHPLADLQADDFKVFEDGQPRPIVLFARATAEDSALAGAADENLVVDAGLLLDTSESMKTPLKLAQEAAIRFLDSVPRARDLLTIFFDQDIRLSRYDSEHQQGLFERILESEAAGHTALYDAIVVYLSRVEDTSGRKVLVLFTDGHDTISKTSQGELRELVRSSAVTIYPISFAENLPSSERGHARAFMSSLAEMTGGRMLSPQSSKDLGQIFDKILEELRAQYVIGVKPGADTGDGRFHRLKVEVKREGLQVRHRPGYQAER